MIYQSIRKLICYGLEKHLFQKRDEIFITNQILDILNLDSIDCEEQFKNVDLETTLEEILNYAVSKGIIDDSIVTKDLFDTKIMGTMVARPSEITDTFYKKYEQSPKIATDYFYNLSCNSNYIRRYRISRDIKWVTKTEFGDLDITINLSKPEKDPKAIAAAKVAPQSGYPKCLLCKECEGYAGRINFPARQNHRVIPIKINNSDWCFQYSPYVYYNEHCIVFNSKHIPMSINHDTFIKLLDFVKLFPHYFVGSNADLPIVGGSILSHDHFQGGNYTFAMAKAPIDHKFTIKSYEDVESGIVKWPMSVIRLRSNKTERLIDLADKILTCWRNYTDESCYIFAKTDGVPHNTITPIARKNGNKFELDLVLRNNITTPEHPLGLFHPHSELHHIKKENIGLIEVMGLAVLPSRLKNEMSLLKKAILAGEDISNNKAISSHAQWAAEIMQNYNCITENNIDAIIEQEIGKVFLKVLEHAGVYKRDENGIAGFKRFINGIN